MKQANILVDKTGAALVTDFGRTTMTDLSSVLSKSVDSSGGTYRWMSPELLHSKMHGTKCRLTRESDCYALGMVIYEVRWLHSPQRSLVYPPQLLTGLKPFYHMPDLTFILPVLNRGEHPNRPLHAQTLGFSDALWELVMLCWSRTSSSRPTARKLLDCLSRASPNWVPPAEYPIPATDASSTTDSESNWSGSSHEESLTSGI